jgi:adenosylcobinamide-GDP ribazoletransferase
MDGLLDFGDGLACQGAAEEKLRAMRDARIGAGGFALGAVVFLTTAFSIAGLHRNAILQALIISEVSAKLSMVIGARMGKAACKGTGSYFIKAMRGRLGALRLLVALIIALSIAMLLLGIIGLFGIAAGLVTCLLTVWTATRRIGGVTGDVFGALNELARMATLVIMVMA